MAPCQWQERVGNAKTAHRDPAQADIVTHIKFVDGTGKIRQTARSSNIGRGLAGGLGMLGVITEVTLQLQPGLGKTRSWGTGIRSDANMAAELLGLWVSAGCSHTRPDW